MMNLLNAKPKPARMSSPHSGREIFRRRRRTHDSMLVFNMSIFNFGGGWQEIFNPLKTRETVG
jgi:hypothetical protein